MNITREQPVTDPSADFFSRLGGVLLRSTGAAGFALLMVAEAAVHVGHLARRRGEVVRQLYRVGVESFGVTEIVALFTGMILSLQAGIELRQYGQEVNVGIIVSQTMCREMGPFMTALIIAASVGSAMAAELGTMAVSEEVEALEVMSINVPSYLVMPRLVALIVMLPALTVYTNIIGVIGGGLVANTQLDVAWSAYFRNVMDFLEMKEIMVGLLKSLVFAVIVATVSCYQGLMARNGAVGVGQATRKAVVISFLMVLIIGYFITRMFY